jgi:hypothetical protein
MGPFIIDIQTLLKLNSDASERFLIRKENKMIDEMCSILNWKKLRCNIYCFDINDDQTEFYILFFNKHLDENVCSAYYSSLNSGGPVLLRPENGSNTYSMLDGILLCVNHFIRYVKI